MQQKHLHTLTDLINQYHKLDLKKIFANIYKKQKDIKSIFIGEYSVPEIIETSDKIIKQLEKELSGFSWKYLPVQNNCNNEYGTDSLIGDLQNLISSFSAQYVNKIPFYLNRLICYQIQNGFWDRKVKQVPIIEEEELNILKTKLETISAHLQEYSKQSNDIIDKLKIEKQDVSKFMKQKSNELQAIEDNYQTSMNRINEINNYHVQSSKTSTKIEAILESVQGDEEEIKEILKSINNDHVKYEESVTGLIKNANASIKEFDKKNMSFKEKLEFVEEKKKYFDEKLKEAEKITGIIAGSSMSETFIKRKKELDFPVKKWQWIVIGMTVITVSAVIAIFTNFFGKLGEIPDVFTTTQIISNTLKTLPFFFLLFYAVSQYNKERNFQEEYAFKSSIAITLNAFADLTGKFKEEFIVDSVTNIYQSPIRYKKAKDKDTEDMMDTAKELLLNTAKNAGEKI